MFIKLLQIAIPFVWFGAVGAISFMEAPLKFTAPYSGLHIVYIVADSVKVLLLFALGLSLAKNALKESA